MKILTRLVFFIIAVFVILSSIFYSANKGLLDTPLKHVLQYYLWTKNINLSFANMEFKDGTIKASNVKFITGEGIGLTKDIEIHADISGDITAPKLSVKLLPNNMLVLAKDSNLIGNRIIEATLSAELNSDLFGENKNYELNIEDIAFDNTGEIKQDEVKQGNAYCKYEGGNVDCKLNLSDSSYITLGNMDANSNKIEINARNIPLTAYEIAYPFLPKNNTLEFFRDTIQSGNLEEAKVEFDPSIKSLDSNLFGIVKIRNVDFSYDEWFPMIKDMDIDAEINGTKLNASVNSAYSSDILISQGVIRMDWQGIEDTVLTIDAKGKGSAYSLADFILTEQHEKMKQANIDFRAVKGNAEVNIDIKIPFSSTGKNSYNITADITDASLNIFKDAIRFENAQISGKFDGFRVTL
ncbi:DUF3971 domain-containing protein, partial [Rickettsiaceae bacterium]|nr:DUF3971 domain-containing protein [Rickettsiaceae bacterium]